MRTEKSKAFRSGRKRRERASLKKEQTSVADQPVIPARIPALNQAYEKLCTVSAQELARLAEAGCRLLRTRQRIHAVVLTPEQEMFLCAPIGGKTGNGMPHANETIINPHGCLTFDYIRPEFRNDYQRVVRSCLVTTP